MNSYDITYVNFPAQYADERDAILAAVDAVLASGQYIMGPVVEEFEQSFADLCGVEYAISLNSGTDALILSFLALGIGSGDEIITAPNSWISSASAIALVGAKPVFVDVAADQNIDPTKLEAAITPNTKAILPVHLTGKCADMDAIWEVAHKHGLHVVEDAAQAAGSKYGGKMAGSIGEIGCFSLHPLKNLNGCGDGGVVVTDSDELAEKLRLLRNHGLKSRNEISFFGYNSRLDAVQAAILNVRIKKLQAVIEKRRQNAEFYRSLLDGVVQSPFDAEEAYDTYHLFVIRTPQRDALQKHLAEKGIETAVHYPVPLHLQPCTEELGYKKGDFPECERQSGEILSLPMHNALTEDQLKRVAETIVEFVNQ